MGPILVIAFIVVPLVELFVILQVGEVVGILNTLVVMVLLSVYGAALARKEGLEVYRRFRQAIAEGRVPSDEALDGVLVLVGAALLLTPGFVTDAVGFSLLIGFTRGLYKRAARAWVIGWLDRRVTVVRGSRGPDEADEHDEPLPLQKRDKGTHETSEERENYQ